MSILQAVTSIADLDVVGGAVSSTASKYATVAESILVNYISAARPQLPTLSAPQTNIWFSAYLNYHDNVPADRNLIRFFDTSFSKSQPIYELYVTSSLAVKIRTWNGSDMTDLGTAGGTMPNNIEGRIDIHITISDTVGVADVWIGGVLASSFSGDSKLAAFTGIDKVSFGNALGTNENYRCYHSAIIIADEDTRGMYMAQSKPTGAGGATDWTGAYTDIDENGYSDADKISTGAVGAVSTFTKTDIAPTYDTGYDVVAVVVAARVMAEGPNGETLKSTFRTGGVNYEGSDLGAAPSFSGRQVVHATNPATSAAWTVAAADATEVGVKFDAA